MSGFDNDVVYAKNADFTQSDNQAVSEANGLATDGQMWIGTTAANAGGTHINVGALTSPNSSITFGYSSPNITAEVNTSVVTDYHDSRYIVSAGGTADGANYTTIASAITAAALAGAPQTIFIQPGTYTENLTLSAGINLAAHDCDAQTPNVTIVGKMTITTAGTVSLSGIRFETNADYILSMTGTAASIVFFKDCFINATNNTAILSTTTSSSSRIFLAGCRGNLATTGIAYFDISYGIISFNSCQMSNSGVSTTNSTAANNSEAVLNYTTFNANISTSGTSSFTGRYCLFRNGSGNATVLTINGTGTNAISDCIIESGTASCLSIGVGNNMDVFDSKFNCSNTNAITGAGNIIWGTLVFTSTSSTINTTTQTPKVCSNDLIKVVTPGAYPYTSSPQDNLILVDTSSARTITPRASPATGQKHIIKDSVGSAAANNITITPSGKNIDGSASYTMNTNYGSVTIIYNGTEWNIV